MYSVCTVYSAYVYTIHVFDHCVSVHTFAYRLFRAGKNMIVHNYCKAYLRKSKYQVSTYSTVQCCTTIYILCTVLTCMCCIIYILCTVLVCSTICTLCTGELLVGFQ